MMASDLRIVLLGKAGAGKNRVAKAILGDIELYEEHEKCVLYEGEHAGKSVCMVDTPGWDRVSIECTTKKIKNEISRSVTLCPPGPHALILVLPVNIGDVPSQNELKSTSRHVELLSERVWDHTMVLFLCDRDVQESTITAHIQEAKKLLEKCSGRHCVMRLSESKTEVHGLLKVIESMVKENLGDSFLPQVYYEVIQSKIAKDISELTKKYEDREEMLKQGYQKRLSQYKKPSEEEPVLKQRRGSITRSRPSFNEDENQAMDIHAIKSRYRDELLALARYYLRPISLLVLAMIGALIGSVVGSNFGVVGSGTGIGIGIVVTVPLALLLINAASLARQSSTLVEVGKPENTDYCQ
ncbi:GTPase IMAP family member 7-like [Silurus meridionalis]|uniref:GTPase IMAP family member 7-like n=1 Tax=Silurus meridionalis TaxID=175797 RepID=UPI001EEBEF9A|nr:GTPase IMAP family member 7-like [Silurus meridionalis]